MSDLLTEHEAANFLRLPPDTLRAWRSRKRGPSFVRVGRLVRYEVASLKAYLEAQREKF